MAPLTTTDSRNAPLQHALIVHGPCSLNSACEVWCAWFRKARPQVYGRGRGKGTHHE
jgi:hypothetical protein